MIIALVSTVFYFIYVALQIKNWLNAILSISVLGLILLCWLEPKSSQSLVSIKETSPRIYILSDQSASMNHTNLLQEKKYKISNKQNLFLRKKIKEEFPLTKIEDFKFSDKLIKSEMSDKIPNGRSSSILASLGKLIQKSEEPNENTNENWVFLLSDGETTENIESDLQKLNILKENKFQIFPIPPTGNYIPSLTVSLADLVTPNLIKINEDFEISFNIRSRVFSNQKIKLITTQNDQQIDNEEIILKRSGIYHHKTKLQIKKSGFHEYTIHLLPDDPRLNRKSISFTVSAIEKQPLGDTEEWISMNPRIISPGESVAVFTNLNKDTHSLKVKLPFRAEYTILPKKQKSLLQIPLLNEGVYHFAVFKDNKIVIKQSANVIPYSVEKEFSGINKNFLKTIASYTKGKVLETDKDLLDLFENFELKYKTKNKEYILPMFIKEGYLILIIFLMIMIWINDKKGGVKQK